MTKAEFYVDYLAAEGYRPAVDDDGDVSFRFEGGTYVLYAVEDDPGYVRLVYPNCWPLETEAERAAALAAASHASRVCKGAKVFVREDGTSVCVAYEAFLADIDQIRPVFSRVLAAMRYAARTFARQMQAAE